MKALAAVPHSDADDLAIYEAIAMSRVLLDDDGTDYPRRVRLAISEHVRHGTQGAMIRSLLWVIEGMLEMIDTTPGVLSARQILDDLEHIHDLHTDEPQSDLFGGAL